MTYREHIRTELLERAAARYPNDLGLQRLYTIGFLQAQLAAAMRADNYVYYRFTQALEHSEHWEKPL